MPTLTLAMSPSAAMNWPITTMYRISATTRIQIDAIAAARTGPVRDQSVRSAVGQMRTANTPTPMIPVEQVDEPRDHRRAGQEPQHEHDRAHDERPDLDGAAAADAAWIEHDPLDDAHRGDDHVAEHLGARVGAHAVARYEARGRREADLDEHAEQRPEREHRQAQGDRQPRQRPLAGAVGAPRPDPSQKMVSSSSVPSTARSPKKVV